jgi:uncharacterized protein YbaA (DUF1428 family)
MYQIFYLFRVPNERIERFLRISGDAGAVYREHGAVNSVVLRITDASSKYGCLGLLNEISVGHNETLFLGIDSFRDVAQLEEVTPRIDSDPRIGLLYKEMKEVVDLKRVIRWEAQEIE